MGAQCSICRDRGRRDLVDAALRAGDSPAELLRKYGSETVGSSSALYRHARSHLGQSPLTNRWASADSTTGEVIADLGELRRALLDDFASARSRSGPSIAAARAAREAANVSQILIREFGSDDELLTKTARSRDELVRLIQRAAGAREGIASELAAIAATHGLTELAEDLQALEASAIAYRKGKAS